MKLHLASGNNILKGWVNADLFRGNKQTVHFDLSKKFPYSNSTVEFIFHEHFLEHLDETDGYNFMKECFRVLKPGGCMRISIPNVEAFFEHLIKYYHSDSFHSNELPGSAIKNSRNHCQAINYWFYGNGSTTVRHKFMSPINKTVACGNHAHKYYYDFRDLKEKLEKIGFRTVRRCDYHQSQFPELRGVEFRPNNQELIVEAIK
jgi:predicted SAM-dependent methyltransferase